MEVIIEMTLTSDNRKYRCTVFEAYDKLHAQKGMHPVILRRYDDAGENITRQKCVVIPTLDDLRNMLLKKIGIWENEKSSD